MDPAEDASKSGIQTKDKPVTVEDLSEEGLMGKPINQKRSNTTTE